MPGMMTIMVITYMIIIRIMIIFMYLIGAMTGGGKTTTTPAVT